MAVMIPRETSTDQRLADLEVKVGAVEKKVDVGFAKVDERFKQVDERFKHIDERFNRLEGRFDAYVRGQWQVGGMIFAALLGILATQL